MMRPLLILLVFTLTACGFTPQYATMNNGTAAQDILRSVSINNIPDASGVILKNKLMDQFYAGGQADALYDLVVSPLTEARQDLDITIDEEATRRQLRVSTDVTLTDRAMGTPVFHRSFYAIASYNVLQSQFTTRVTEQNARENAIADLARQIEQAVVLSTRNTGALTP